MQYERYALLILKSLTYAFIAGVAIPIVCGLSAIINSMFGLT